MNAREGKRKDAKVLQHNSQEAKNSNLLFLDTIDYQLFYEEYGIGRLRHQ